MESLTMGALTELRMLEYSVILGIVQLFVASQAAMTQRSLKWNVGARDEKIPDLTGIPGRLDRAFKNFMETFIFFAVAVLLVAVTNAETAISALGAQLYFFARVAYVPIYAIGTPFLRTIVWFAALIGLFMVISALI